MAETFTDNLKLSKRDTGDLNWGAGANANLDVVDGHAQLKNLRPPRTLFASLGSGAVGANLIGNTTYFYKITAINELGETTENRIPSVTEAQITQPATPVPIILSWETVPGATGYKIYKGTSTNAEEFLTQVVGGATATFTDTGNTATQAGQNVPTINSALLSVTGVRKIGEATPLRGDVKLEAGPNVVLTQDPVAGKITIEASGGSGGVTSVRKEGEASGLTGDVKLRAGTNIALTQDGVSNAIEIISTASGGQSPYVAVVASPTGVPATDKANIQAALDSVPAAGGTVVLKEGTYVIDASVTPKASTVIVGQGIRATIINQNVDGIIFGGAVGNDITIRDLGLTGTSTVTTDLPTILNPTAAISRWKFIRVRFFSISVIMDMDQGWSDIVFHGCEFDLATPSAKHFQIQKPNTTGGRFIVEGCKFNLSGMGSSILIRGGGGAPEQGGGHLFKSNIVDCTGGSFPIVELRSHYNVITGNYFRFNFTSDTIVFSMPGTQNIFSHNTIVNLGNARANMRLVPGALKNVLIGNKIHPLTSQIILMAGGVSDNVVVGNKATISDSSGDTSNVLASNFVTGLRKEGEASALVGDVKLRAGSNISLTQDGAGNAVEIAAASGGVASLRKTGDTTGLVGDVSIDQGSDISVTQDTPNNKVVISYSGPKGYATVIAPSPNGTNDTANLQASLDAIPTGTGGVVILREGVYRVDNLILQRTGTRLVGSGSGRDTGSDLKGTQIRSTGFSGDILKIQASNVTIENITFYGIQLPDGFAIISGNPSIQITRCEIRGCLFDGIKAAVDGIRLPLVFFLSITDCQFWMSEVATQSVSRTPNAIKIGPTTFGFSLDEVLITNCMFRINYPNPTAGTITAKAIDLTKVKSAIIANCQGLGINGSANRIYIFTELKQDAALGSNAIVKGNTLTGFTQFIKQTSAFPKVAVGNNVFSQPAGTDPAIDLASGNTEWAITGNVLEGTTGINLQAGADNNVVQGNVASVVNSGSGNSLGGGGQSPFTAVVAAPTGVAATDTANIQNAINSLGTVGGTVVLKEGDYVVSQIDLNKDGLKLIGSGSARTESNTVAGGTRILGNNAGNHLIKVSNQNIVVENIIFSGLQVPDGFGIIDCGLGGTAGRYLKVKSCTFLDIKAKSPGAVIGTNVVGIQILDSIFILNDPAARTDVCSPISIQLQGGSGGLRTEISRCIFKSSYTVGAGGSITAKYILTYNTSELVIANCQASATPSASVTNHFLEMNTTTGTSKNIVISGNTMRSMTGIMVNGKATKVIFVGNNFTDPDGSNPTMELFTGNIGWTITSNVLEGLGLFLYSGANNNIIVGNITTVSNSGTGNSVANNVAA